MQKSLFSKYFSIYVSMIFVCIATLGVILLVFASRYFTEDKYALLAKNATTAVNLTIEDYIYNGGHYIDPETISSGYQLLSNSIDADIFLADVSGKTLVCTEGNGCNHKAYLVPEKIISVALQNDYYEGAGTLGKIYSSVHYTVGIPMVIDGTTVAIVFVSTSGEGLTSFLKDLTLMFIISALVVIAVAFVVIYFVTSSMVKPLREMLEAVETFSKGDFTKRVPVRDIDELGTLAMAFNNMADNISTLETVRRSFIANISHELKTPMTTIAGFVDGILDGTIPPEKQSHYLAIISCEVKRLSRLVRSMLNIAKIEAGEMTISPSPIDVNDLVCQSIFTFEHRIEEKHLDIRGLDCGRVMVSADKDLIHQVVYNLLENAVKFSNEGGYIEVSYTADHQKTYISIKNSGKGIPKEEISKVFDRFYKTDTSRSLDKTGVGLGLHIVKSIVNLHNGEIIVKSVENEYCEFVFSLPSVHQAERQARAAAKKGTQKTSEK